MAHELGHGIFTLHHTFDENYGGSSTTATTDNLMDYAGGEHLAAFQWNTLANPAPITAFDSDDQSNQNYATRREWIGIQLNYLRERSRIEEGVKVDSVYAEDMKLLLDSLLVSGGTMGDVYPIYDNIDKRYKQLKAEYMMAIAGVTIEVSLAVMDLLALNGLSEIGFKIYSSYLYRKVGYTVSSKVWTNTSRKYFEPLGKGSTANSANGTRANAETLSEQLVVKEIKANPLIGKDLSRLEGNKRIVLGNSLWSSKNGWRKFQYTKKLSDGNIISVHYNVKLVNDATVIAIDDIKFIQKKVAK